MCTTHSEKLGANPAAPKKPPLFPTKRCNCPVLARQDLQRPFHNLTMQTIASFGQQESSSRHFDKRIKHHNDVNTMNGMNSKTITPCVPLHNIPPLPFMEMKMPPNMLMEDNKILPPPLVRRDSELPGTPSTAATTSSFEMEKTLMEVTITVLSLDGLIAKRDEPKERSSMLKELSSLSSHGRLSLSKHGLSRLSFHGRKSSTDDDKDKDSERYVRHSSHGKSKSKLSSSKHGSMNLSNHDKATSSDSSQSTKPEVATLVASFSHSVSKDVLFTHLPSHPMELSSATVQPIAYWSSKADVDDGEQALSTLKFKRPFVKKSNSSSLSYIPQMCPIKLSISRNGTLISIGKANIAIHGTEDGENTISASVVSLTKSKSKYNLSSKSNSFPMFKAKGDGISFGLRPDAKLRVLIHVSVPDAPVCSSRNLCEPVFVREVGESTVYQDRVDSSNDPIGSSMNLNSEDLKVTPESTETKTDSNCSDESHSTNDDSEEEEIWEEYIQNTDDQSTDEEVWEEYIVEENELRQLREQLAKSENSNKSLQNELIQSREALQVENEKYEAFCTELESVKKNSEKTIESLKEELHVARCECVMLPMYEMRINELLDELKVKDDSLKKKEVELKERDDEIACLRDEIQEIKTGFRSQVDALLWDNDSQADDSVSTNTTSQTGQTQQSQGKTEKWLAANMTAEWTGLRNAFMRSGRKLQVAKEEDGASSVKSVKWDDEKESKPQDDKVDEDEEDKVGGGHLISEEDPAVKEHDSVSSDEDANDVSYGSA